MKTRLVLLGLLFLPSVAWTGSDHAKSPIPNLTVCQPSNDCGQEPLVYQSEIPCLAKMEAAMKAMDPFLFSGMRVTVDSENFDQEVWDRWLVYQQWLEAKRDCWRATGSPGTP